MKNRFIISESERQSILYQHRAKYGWLSEQTTGTTASTVSNTGTTQPQVATPAPTPEPRWKTLMNVSKPKALQARINDECPREILQPVLEKYPRAREGSAPNYKLREDGIAGKGTIAANNACNGKWIVGAVNGILPTPVGGGGGATGSQLPKVGEPLNANDIATLTSA